MDLGERLTKVWHALVIDKEEMAVKLCMESKEIVTKELLMLEEKKENELDE